MVKMMTSRPVFLSMRYAKQVSFILAGKKRYSWFSWSTVWYLLETATRTGSFRAARYSFSTLSVMVAEKRRVCLEAGSASTILSSCPAKSSLSNLSASSIMRYLMLLQANALVFCMWKRTFPGVPTTMWGPELSAFTWDLTSIEPMITATLSPTLAPRALRCSEIWTTSSRAGAKTSPKQLVGLSKRCCTRGSAKASVLPLPVSARAMRSFPAREQGREADWILVGVAQLRLLHARRSSSQRRVSSNEFSSVIPYWDSINNVIIIL